MKAVIFDFDGTIVDSLAGVIKVYEQVRGGTSRLSPEERRKLQNLSLLQIAVAMRIPKWKILYLAVWGRRMFNHHMRSVNVHPGMEQVIRELHQRGIPIFVLSANRTENVRKYLGWHGLDAYFTRIHGGASFFSKTRAMRNIVRKEGLDPKNTWCIGDERVDIRSAHKAGLKAVAVTWGYSNRENLMNMQPEALVDDAKDILPAMDMGSAPKHMPSGT